jgi:hypothetical protein
MADDLEQRIRERAYELWENEGCPEGRGDEHWQQACAEYRDAREEANAEQGAGLSGTAGSTGGTSAADADDLSPGAPVPSAEQGTS